MHILPPERSESMEPRLRSSLSPRPVSGRPSHPMEARTELAATAKSVESQLEEQSARAKTLQGELDQARMTLTRKQDQEEQKQSRVPSVSPSPRPAATVQLGIVPEEEPHVPSVVATPTMPAASLAALSTLAMPEQRVPAETDETLDKIRQILKEKHPSLEALMDVSLKQEREKHERQNEKVLQILKIKDGVIDELQQKVSELETQQRTGEASTEEVQKQLRDLQKENAALQTREQQLLQSVAEHEETIKLLNESREQLKSSLQPKTLGADMDKAMAELRQKLEAQTEQSVRDKETISQLGKELAEAQRKLGELKKREDYVLELANRQEDIKRRHEDQMRQKDGLVEQAQKLANEQQVVVVGLKQKLEKLEKDAAKYQSADSEINKLREEKAELEGKVQEMEELCRTDNEKLANIVKQFKGKEQAKAADRSFTIEDLRSTSKDYIGRLKDQIEQQQKRIDELLSRCQELEAKSKLSDDVALAHQSDKASLIAKYTEEIARQQKTILELSQEKIAKHVETQTALKGDNISDLSRLIEEYKSKLEYAAQQRDEREKHIAEMEQELRKQVEDSERAKAELDTVVKHCDESHSAGISQLEQSEVVSKLNARVSALQIQVHQLQSKLQQAEEELSQRRPAMEPMSVSSLQLQQRTQPAPSQVSEHMAERADALEIVIVQLREEVIQLEVEKRNLEQALRLELDTKEAKIKALEGLVNSNFAKDPSQLYAVSTKVELEKARETAKLFEDRLALAVQDSASAQKELIRLKQMEKLSTVLPSDGEIAIKLTNKIKTQRAEIRRLQALLKRAKVEFDRLSSAMQARVSTVAGEKKQENGEKESGSAWGRLEAARYEQQVQDLARRCEDYRRKLNESLRILLELKDEFSRKLVEKEERNQRQLFRLAEECRQKARDSELLTHKLGKMTEKLQDAQNKAETSAEQLAKISATFTERIRQLEDTAATGRRAQEETRAEVKRHELVIQERSAQITVLMETIETVQKNSRDATAQKYMNANVELCSAKAMYAKLEGKCGELEALYQDARRGAEQCKKREADLEAENVRLVREATEARQIVDAQTKQIERLEESLEESRIEVASGVAKSHGLEEQLRVKDRRLDMFRTQITEMQQSFQARAGGDQAAGYGKRPIPSSAAKSLKSPAPPSLNTTISRQWEETKEGAKPGEARQIAVLLKQLLADIQKEFGQFSGEQKQTELFDRLSAVVLRSDQVISDLERTNADLEQKLVAAQVRSEERAGYEKALMRCDALANENTELSLMLETMISRGEESKLEHIQKLEQSLAAASQALRSADLKLISSGEHNSALKASLQETQDKMEAKIKEAQVARVKLEKELALSRIKAEEEMSLKLSIRNEEIKTYFDTHVSKLILGKEEGSQILSLSREVCAQKLLVEKLQMQLGNSDKGRGALDLQVQDLLSVLAKNTAQLEELQYAECTKLRRKAEQLAAYSQGKTSVQPGEPSKKVLKAELDRKNAELADITGALQQLKEQNAKLKVVSDRLGSEDTSIGKRAGGILEEMEVKIAALTSALEEKDKAIEALEKKLVEASSEHALEIQNMQSDMELRLQDERKSTMQEFDLLAKKYKPGEAPGEIAAENQALKNQCVALRQTVERLEGEQVVLRQKVTSLSEDVTQSRNEAELFKKSLAELQDVMNVIPEQTPMSSRMRSTVLTPADRKSKKKQAAGGVPAEEPVAVAAQARTEAAAVKLPRFVRALMVAKFNEADAEARVRRLARTELELRRDLTKAGQQVKDLESRMRHYERLLKDNNVRATAPPLAEAGSDEDVAWLKKRVLELEATCEDMKLKELQNLTTYTGVMSADPIPSEEDQNMTGLLVQGVVALCSQLAATETQLRERRLEASSSSFQPSTISAAGAETASSASTERVQRIIIRSLTGMLRKAMGDTSWNAQCTVPTSETDRQVWYLELMELQTQNVERAIAQLKEYTTKISVEITGSLASAAQVKAAAMELANQTKEAAELVANLRNMCALTRRDLEDMVKESGIGKSASAVPAGNSSNELAERLAFAEKMRKNLENEVSQLKLALSYHQTEGKQIVEGTKGEVERILKRNRDLETELNEVRKRQQTAEKELMQEKSANDELRLDLQTSTRKTADLAGLLEKYKAELKESARDAGKVSEKEDSIRGLEAKRDVLTGQCEILMRENRELKDKLAQEAKKGEESQNEVIKALKSENKELDAKLHAEIEERKTEIEFWIKERAQMRQLIDSLKFEKDASRHAPAAGDSKSKSSATLKGKSVSVAKKEGGAVMSDTEGGEKRKDSAAEAKRRVKKYREKIKKMKAELEAKSVDLFKLQADIQDLKSKLHISDLNTDEERRKVISLSGEMRDMQMRSRVPESAKKQAAEEIPQVSKAQLEELQTSLETMKQQIEKLERDVSEKTRREEELKRERDKMVIVIQELDREVKMKEKEFADEKARLEDEAKHDHELAEQREKQVDELHENHRRDTELIAKHEGEIKIGKDQLEKLRDGHARLVQSHKELETVVLSQEEVITKQKLEYAEREQEMRKEIEALHAEHKETKRSADELVALYETQLKLLKEKFKEEYVELNNRLTIQAQGKGSMSPKKKEQTELSVDLMFQISQKDAQTKTLEKEAAQLRGKTKKCKATIAKLQAQLKDALAAVPRPKPKVPAVADPKRKSAKAQIQMPMNEPQSAEEQLKAYNVLLKQKTELELRLGKLQNGLKALEAKVQMERERADEAELKLQSQAKDCDDLRESLKSSKKEQAETAKKHKSEMQKLLDELIQVKNNWKSPDELVKCQEERKEAESQLKQAKDELNRKKELMRQWKEKDELRQSEAGQLMTEVSAAKDDSEKLKKVMKELLRKDQTIKSLKTAMENERGLEKQLAEENKGMLEKLKTMKAETARKDTALKAFREKSEEVKTDKENVKGKDSEIDKLKTRIATYDFDVTLLHNRLKQDVDRKDEQLKALKAKVESLMKDLDSAKAALDATSKVHYFQAKRLCRVSSRRWRRDRRRSGRRRSG